MRTGWILGAAGLAVAALAGALAGPAAARREPAKKVTYYFAIEQVELKAGVPADIGPLARTVLAESIGKRTGILTALPAGAPDPASAPRDFKRYLKNKRLRAYRVTVEVSEYSHTLEPLPEPRNGQRLTVRVVLRLFGETIPDRTMAFAGDGAATVKLEIGKKLRPVDSDAANHDALDQALGEALDTSLAKLKAPPPGPSKPAKKRS